MRLKRWFWLILAFAFVVRLIAAWFAPHPGISDPNHYYNLASNLAEGRGFVIDYIWQYHMPPNSVTHPIDYWMPLPAIWPALGLMIAPNNLFASIIPSTLIGTLVVVLAYGITATINGSETERLLAMAAVVFLPQHVLNSVRTDTTISYILFVGLACLFFYRGLRCHPLSLLWAGVFAGLGQLSRQDGIILAPAMILALFFYWRWAGTKQFHWRWIWLIPLGWIGIMLPWFVRNYALFGVVLPGSAARTMFMTSFIDQFTYGRTLNLQHYLDWGLKNILFNISFQVLANVKTMYTVLDIFLPISVTAGFIGLVWRGERERLLMLVLPLTMLLGLFSFYSFVTPFHTMGGSFFKSYQFIIPFLAMVGAWGITTYVSSRRVIGLIAVVMMSFMLLNSFDTIRLDFAAAARFNQSIIDLKPVLDDAGDINNDGEIIMMTQDPYILNYHGYKALMIPSDSRELILEAAYRYHVDYILLPAARAALDSLYNQAEHDGRLVWQPATDSYQLLAVVSQDE